MDTREVPPPEQGEPLPWADDRRAEKEENAFDDEKELRGQRTRNDLWWLQSYGLLVVLVTWFFVLLLLASLLVWSWHQLAPEPSPGCLEGATRCWQWLTEEQESKIQSIIFSGSIGAIVSAVAQRQLRK